MSSEVVNQIRDLIQEDVGNRGLRTDPNANLITACPHDFHAACRSLAATPNPGVAIVTGFFIPHAQPPAGETDGPLGAVFLARALVPLNVRVALVTDPFCERALEESLSTCDLGGKVPVVTLPRASFPWEAALKLWQEVFLDLSLTHWIALERVGPSHTPASLRLQSGVTAGTLEQFSRDVSGEHYDRCHNMLGRDITSEMRPAHVLFEAAAKQNPPLVTIGIGDGGNEIGMGKIPWEIIRRNIPRGGLIACRVPTDYLIVSGVSNWGAYGLAAGVRCLRGAPPDKELFNVDREREILKVMVERGPLVDGVLGRQSVSVDGLPFDRYAEPLRRLATICS